MGQGGDGINIYNLDCLVGMKDLGDESVDLITTDPPYGIAFMGKDWDKFNEIVDPQGAYAKKKGFKKLPRQNTASMAEFFVPIWTECLRVLKAGAFAFVMCSPRADVMAKQINALQDAGFQVNFTPIYWAYASGFPKAQNIGKAVDKRNGRLVEEYKALGNYLRGQRGDRPQKGISKFFPSKTGGLTGCVANWELGLNVPTKEQWIILKRELDLDNRFDALIEREEAEREVILSKGSGRKRDNTSFSNGLPVKEELTKPATSQAKALDGSYGGFQPKPAVEVIIVAMKPLSEKTFVDQALKNKKGITWLDDCRIPYGKESDKRVGTEATAEGFSTGAVNFGINPRGKGVLMYKPQGRFPANLLVSDDVLNDGVSHSGGSFPEERGETAFFGLNKAHSHRVGKMGDSGSFSRYFDLDKWWTGKVKELPESVQKTFPFLVVPKASKGEKDKGLGNLPERLTPTMEMRKTPQPRISDNPKYNTGTIIEPPRKKNIHPTVKPIKLFSYLVTLGSRAGDMVLDPFGGTMTTAMACAMLGRQFIGYEIDVGSYEISEGRVKAGWQIKLEALGGKG